MYFTNFPKIFYDFPNSTSVVATDIIAGENYIISYAGSTDFTKIGASSNNIGTRFASTGVTSGTGLVTTNTRETTLQILTDITSNVRVRKAVLENITLYDEYDIKEGETPEIIAERVYGNPELHWIIMLVNQRYDYLKDFPMSSLELQQHMEQTYGAGNLDQVHHYELNGVINEAKAIMKIPSAALPFLKVNDFIRSSGANCRIDSIDLVNKTVGVLNDYGRFFGGEPCVVYGVRFDTILQKMVYGYIADFVIPTNGYTINDKYDIITNSMYEIKVNESKRTIKLISGRLVDQIINEFESLMA